MKSKVSLVLTELCIMLLVLAVAAVLCLRVFVWAEDRSGQNAARDAALIQMQSVAELLKATGDPEETARSMNGSKSGDHWYIPMETYEIRILPAQTEGASPPLVYLEAVYRDTVLIRFPVSWQEVAP
jgi:hypothetical protein